MNQIFVNKGIEFAISASCDTEGTYKAVLRNADGSVMIEASGSVSGGAWQFAWSAEQTKELPVDVDITLEIVASDLSKIFVCTNFAVARDTCETLPITEE